MSGIQQQRKKVWILEDDAQFSRALGRAFEAKHFEVELFADATSARERLETLTSELYPDCILTDLHLPEVTGEEWVQWLQDRPQFDSIAVITMSGFSESFQDQVVPFFHKDGIQQSLIPFLSEHLEELSDMQFLKRIAQRTGIPESRLGKVDWFDANRGWGLLKVIGREKALFVNASDILPSDAEPSMKSDQVAFRFIQLHPGEVVSFEPNERAARGPRAERVQRLRDKMTNH